MAHDVFISHSHEDKALADATCAALEAQGIRCWIAPRDILAGRDWASSIADAVGGARVMVLIYSANSVDSDHVKKELTLGVESNTIIVPLRIENVPLSGMMQYYLTGTHWLDAMNPPSQHEIQLLVDTVKSLLRGATHLENPQEATAEATTDMPAASAVSAVQPPEPAVVPAAVPPEPAGMMPSAAMPSAVAPSATPAVSPTAPAYAVQPPPPASTGNGLKIAAIIAAVTIGVILLAVVGYGAVRFASSQLSKNDNPPATQDATEEPLAAQEDAEDPVAVTTPSSVGLITLAWSTTDDLDIDIWSAETGDYIGSSFDLGGHDSLDGTTGEEYLDLAYIDDSLVVESGYFILVSNMTEGQTNETAFTITIEAADGSSRSFDGTVTGIEPNDIWIVCQVDSSNGEVLEEIGEIAEF